jgi:hypothetical protein
MRHTITKITLILLAALITIGGATSCKSKKRLAKEAAEAEYNAKVAEAIKDLTAILDDETVWTLEEKENRVETIKEWNLQHAEVDDLIFQVEKKLARERAQADRKAEEEKRLEEERKKAQNTNLRLEENFRAIASASSNEQANYIIAETMDLFETPNAPVLIIISQAGGFNDYDRPTTIEKYLNYLKDQKVSRNQVSNVRYGTSGKITELELIKK